MVEPENKLVCQSNTGTGLATEQRQRALLELGLIEAQTIPVFEEATQSAAHLLEVPICILGFLDRNRHCFKSAVGLSRLGLMNQLAQERQLPESESFCTQVVETNQVVAISDTLSNPAYANSILVQRYGIRSYLGAPLIDAAGCCLGAIAVMDLQPRIFTTQQMKFLELMARWSMSEFERSWLLKSKKMGKLEQGNNELAPAPPSLSPVSPATPLPDQAQSLIQVKLKLLEQLTQELRTPLTSILGMANVVGREIYGPLTNKQKEYLEIVQNSGRYLLSLVNEISHLGVIEQCDRALNLTSVDIEMLCQQILNTLEEAAKRKEQKLQLSLEPAKNRTWMIDKDKVKQLLYHLISSMIQAATSGSIIRIHVSHKAKSLNLAISVSHPWLGEGLTPVDPYLGQIPVLNVSSYSSGEDLSYQNSALEDNSDSLAVSETEILSVNSIKRSCESLRLLLSRSLVELHGGQIDVLGTPESGYRYVVSLPELAVTSESSSSNPLGA
jgi:hypothetical protein